jgi:hypothetical protein
MEFVALDLGASSTRYISNNGKVGILPNNMQFIQLNTRVDLEPYNDEIEGALDVTIECDKASEFFPVRVLAGSMAARYSPTNVRPSVMANKYMQKINYVSAVLASAVCKEKNVLGDELILYVGLPPVEVNIARDIIRDKLMGHYKVTFNKLDKQVEFDIVDVGCFEESFMAILSYFFDANGKLREQAKKYSYGNVLSLDIGASTTDLVVVSDMKYLERSGQTYKTGGNVAREFLRDDLRALYGYDVPDEIADIAMAEGRIQMGNRYEDISSLVESAKQRFAAQVVEQMQGYFRKVNIPIQTIRAIIVSGGGSMRSEYVAEDGSVVVTSQPMSYYITQELNKVCPGVEVEPHVLDARLANIYGLFIRANIDVRKRMSKVQKQATA